MSEAFETETVATDAGEYTINWFIDDHAERPYNDGLGFAFDGGLDRIDVADGEHADEVLDIIAGRISGSVYTYSSAGIARYLRMKYGLTGIREVSHGYSTSAPDTPREKIWGIAWAPSDVPAEHAEKYTDAAIAEYRAWAQGDVFGYTVTDPAGNEIESCWGFYGWDDQHDHIRGEILAEVKNDAETRLTATELIGAGFVGII